MVCVAIISSVTTLDLRQNSFAAPAVPVTIGSGSCTTTVNSTTGVTASTVGTDCVLSFTSTTSYTWTSPASVTSLQFLIIGGGGGGGSRHSGGGGAGGMLMSSAFTVTPLADYTISVGAGGAGLADGTPGCGNAGSPSTFGIITANGGGPGCNPDLSTAGGSSGGTGNISSTPAAATPGSVGGTSLTNAVTYMRVTGYGKRGGYGWSTNCQSDIVDEAWCGGGGGGAGSAGVDASTEGAGAGGAGLLNEITGSSKRYAGGGGGSGGRSGACGGVGADGGPGGTGGGGKGGGYNTQVTQAGNGTANTGSGGGGGTFCGSTNYPGGSGGSGIVIVRWTPDTTAPTVSAWTPPATPTNSRSMSFGLSFDESVTDLTSDDVTNSGTATCSFSPNTTSGTTFTITATCTTDGTVTPVLATSAVADLNNNTGPTSTSTSPSVTVDTATPTVTWDATATYPSSLVARFSFTTSESVSGVSASDFSASGSAAPCTMSVSASTGSRFTVDATCTQAGTATLHLASLAITDGAGNTAPIAVSDSPPATQIKQSQTTLEVSTATAPYGRTTTLTSTGGSGTGVVTFTVASGSCTISSGDSLTPGPVGSSCLVFATKASDTDYNEAVSSQKSLTITKGSQTGFAISSGTTFEAGSSHPLTTTGGQGTGVVSWSVTAGPCTLTGATLSTTRGDITCTVEATRSGDNNYLETTAVQTIAVTAAPSISDSANTPATPDTPRPQSPGSQSPASQAPSSPTPLALSPSISTTTIEMSSSFSVTPVVKANQEKNSTVATPARRSTSSQTTVAESSTSIPADATSAVAEDSSDIPSPDTTTVGQRNTAMTISVLSIATLLAMLAGRPLVTRRRLARRR